MTFDDLLHGMSVFLDAHLFVYAFSLDPHFGLPCQRLLDRIARQELVGYTSTHVLSEAVHRLMTLEAIASFGWAQAGIGNRLRHNPAHVQRLSQFRQAVQQVTRIGVHALTIPLSLLDIAAAVCQQVGLLINDGLVVAVMQANGLAHLASLDHDFDRVPGLTRYAPA
jgi:predicted nucleic acid-binding protein